MKNFKGINSFFSALLLSSFAALVPLADKAVAQFKVSPLVIETTVKKGQASGTITVTNVSSEPARFRIKAFPFTYGNDGFAIVEESDNDLTPFLNYSPRELAIQPGETRRVRFVSRLLPSTPAGEYRAVITSERLVDRANTGSQVSTVARMAVVVFVRHGDADSNLTIQAGSYNPTEKKIDLLAVNSGNASVRPSVIWKLKQKDKVVTSGYLDATTIIAEGERTLSFEYPEATSGEYQLTGELKWANNQGSEKMPFAVDVVIP